MKKVVAFMLSAFFLFLASPAHANTVYKTKKGDTLQKIADKFHLSIPDIKGANNLKTNHLKTGMKLSIPDGSDSKAPSKGKASKSARHAAEKKDAVSAQDNEAYHLVKKGDTLKTVAKKYSMSVNELKRINNLKKGKLRVGRQLLVTNPEPKTYTVKKGDTLKKVAKKLKMDIEELKGINGLENDTLKPGRKLLLAKKPEPKEEEKTTSVLYDRKITPVITSERLAEVKSMSKSEDILSDLSMKDRLILFAKKMLHLPYRFGGSGSFGLDCSAYVQKAYGFVGLNIPRSAREQFNMGEVINKEQLSTGDLVFFRTYASFPSHVGIYLGNNLFIHASSLSKKITIDSLESPYYLRRFIGAKRLIPEEAMESEDSSPAEN